MKMWSGRFRQPLDPEFEKWQRSFSYDQRLLPFELAASRAHANALAHAGVLPPKSLLRLSKRSRNWPPRRVFPECTSSIRMRRELRAKTRRGGQFPRAL